MEDLKKVSAYIHKTNLIPGRLRSVAEQKDLLAELCAGAYISPARSGFHCIKDFQDRRAESITKC